MTADRILIIEETARGQALRRGDRSGARAAWFDATELTLQTGVAHRIYAAGPEVFVCDRRLPDDGHRAFDLCAVVSLISPAELNRFIDGAAAA